MNTMQLKARKYWAVGTIAVRNRWRYPAEMTGPVITYGLFVFVFSRLWMAMFSGKDEIAGYSREACTWYFVVTEFCVMTASGAFASLSRDIKDGQVAYTLGRPFGLLLNGWAQRLGMSLSLLPLLVVVGYAIASLHAGPWIPDSPLRVAAVLAGYLLSIGIQFCVNSTLAMIAFWFEENSAFQWIWSKLTLVVGTLMPLEFLPEAWQRVLVLTPLPWVSWAPAKLAVVPVLDLPTLARLLGGQLAWLLITMLIAQVVYRLAVRHATIQGG